MGKWLVSFMPYLVAYGHAGDDAHNRFLRETFVHPAGGYTAYTLPGGCGIYAQPIDLKPGIIQAGLNDKNTIILPLNHWFEKTVSIGFRSRFKRGKRKWTPATAMEVHYQYLTAPVNPIDPHRHIEVWRLGHHLNWRTNLSWHPNQRLYVHFSPGITYTELFNVNIPDSTSLNDIIIGNSLTPDMLLLVEWRPAKWYALLLQLSYGSTFFYAENTPRKKQILVGARLAPFDQSSIGFLSHFRIECVYQGARFDKNNYFYNTITGHLYWRFGIRK